MVKVDPDFNTEYPNGDATSTEAYATLARAGAACLQELERLVAAHFDMPMAAATAALRSSTAPARRLRPPRSANESLSRPPP